MKKLEEPIIEVIDFNAEDVICTSNDTSCGGVHTLDEIVTP